MLRFAIIFAICFLAAALVYRKAPTAFLRAETGFYLCVSHSDEGRQRDFKHGLFTTSYGGHYTPLLFWAEFEMAKFAGTARDFWRWRQILAVSLTGAAAFLALEGLMQNLALPRGPRLSIAAALSAFGIFLPAMIEFVSWPFMLMQLLWLTLLMLALYFLVRLVGSPAEKRWAWLAAGAAYLSMHVSGLGAVTVVAVAAVFVFLLRNGFSQPRYILGAARKRLLTVLSVLSGAAALHGWAMIYLLPANSTPESLPAVHSLAAARLLLGFVFHFFWAGVRGFSLTLPPAPLLSAIEYCWPLGVLCLMAAAVGFYNLARLAKAALSPGTLGVIIILLFSATGSIVLVFMMIVRLIAEAPAGGGIPTYLTVFPVTPRYIIPLQFLLLGPAALLLATLGRSRPRKTTLACCAIAVAAMITQWEFQMHGPMRSIMSGTRINHNYAWRLLRTTARACRAADLPMPNLPLKALTEEFDGDVESFLPLLRHDLALAPEAKLELVAWPFTGTDNLDAYAKISSLKELERKLGCSQRETKPTDP